MERALSVLSLHHDLLCEILRHLPVEDICRAELVCTAFRAAACDEWLWERICRQHAPFLPGPQVLRYTSWKEMCRSEFRTLGLNSLPQSYKLLEVTTYHTKLAGNFSPDGRFFAACDFALSVWHMEDGERFGLAACTSPKRDDWFNQVHFSPDSRTLAACSDGGLIAVYRLVEAGDDEGVCTLEPLEPWPNVVAELPCMAFSPDGKLVACGTAFGDVRLCDVLPSGALRLRAPSDPPMTLRAADSDGTVSGPADMRVQDIQFSPDGRWLAAAGARMQVWLWRCDLATGAITLAHRVTLDKEVFALAFSPLSQLLAVVGANEHVVVLERTAEAEAEAGGGAGAGADPWRVLCDARPEAIGGLSFVQFAGEQLLLTNGTQAAAYLWRVQRGPVATCTQVDIMPHDRSAGFDSLFAVLSRNRRWIITNDSDMSGGGLALWEVTPSGPQRTTHAS